MGRRGLGRLGVGFVLALAAIGVVATQPADAVQAAKGPPKFIGAAKCKNCHANKDNGDQYGHWKEEKHAKAFEVLASPEALAAAKAAGVADPATSEKCAKCHATGFGLPAERLAKGFDLKAGVQCESCHGPGEAHMKARMAAAAAAGDDTEQAAPAKRIDLPAGEIVGKPEPATCLGCHNKESPTFKPFCYKRRSAQIAHHDPRKVRSQAEQDAAKCGCPTENCGCEKCEKGECGK